VRTLKLEYTVQQNASIQYNRLRVFKNRVLRISGPNKHEVTGGWRKLHSEELHKLY
jgi:hypothetical protein